MTKLEQTLKTLKVDINRYVIEDSNKHDVVVTGGIEVIDRYSVKDFKEVNGDWERIDIKGSSNNERILLPFTYSNVKFNVKHLENIVKFRGVKGLTKEEASKYKIEKKEDLESKIVYVHENKPSTNSLALAKQFKLEHHNIIKQLFKLAGQNPSILMGIEYGFYELVNNGQIPENQGSESSLPSNLGLSQYLPFLQITEDVYYKFVMKLGTPKSKAMVVYRYEKQEEYFQSFQNLREMLYKQGYKEDEIITLIRQRTIMTNKLLDTINDYVIHYNNNSGVSRQISVISLCRILFNVINKLAGIDAKHYRHKSKDRNEKNHETQMILIQYETSIIASMKSSKRHESNLVNELCDTLEVDVNYLEQVLKDNKVSGLISTLTKLKQ